jgi:uncharacterized membrane protein YqjE
MLFAPAFGIVGFQVIGGLSWFLTIICCLGILRQWFAPTETLDVAQLATIAVLSAVGGLFCFWIARKIRAAVQQ